MVLIKSKLVFVPIVSYGGKEECAFVNPAYITGIIDNVQENNQKSTIWLTDQKYLLCTLTAQEAHTLIYSSKKSSDTNWPGKRFFKRLGHVLRQKGIDILKILKRAKDALLAALAAMLVCDESCYDKAVDVEAHDKK